MKYSVWLEIHIASVALCEPYEYKAILIYLPVQPILGSRIYVDTDELRAL